MQDKNSKNSIFLERTDSLAKALGITVRELSAIVGISPALMFSCRSGKNEISPKTWTKLQKAEQNSGIYVQKNSNTPSFDTEPHIKKSVIEQVLEKQTQQNQILSQALAQMLEQSKEQINETQASYGNTRLEKALAPIMAEIKALRKECEELKKQRSSCPYSQEPPKKVAG